VILSGTASDGAAGVQAVKREGGVSLAQDPGTSKYHDMPGNTIATGAVDFVLPIPLLARRDDHVAPADRRAGTRVERDEGVRARRP
jgi:chemotaxis response regulator CheB